jgi:hypothetical protein
MANRAVVLLGAVMLVIGTGLAFYWYEYRPSQIRATCEAKSTEQAAEFFRQAMGKNAGKVFEGLYGQANKEAYYLSCVREHGLER